MHRRTVLSANEKLDNKITINTEPIEYSKEFIDFTKNDICSEMFNRMAEEAKDAEIYMRLAEDAQITGCECLEEIFLKIANDEILHFEMLYQEIQSMYGNLKENVLYPLLKNLDDWIGNIKDELEEIKHKMY